MALPRLIAIVGMASNRVIGRNGALPWHLPEDLKFFKRTTMGHPILMGRKTFDSIGRPLPGRKNIVLSSTMPPREGVEVIRELPDLGRICQPDERVFLIGGAQLFETLLPLCEGMYLTWIEHPYEGDVRFPEFEDLFEEPEIAGVGEGMEFRFYRRRRD